MLHELAHGITADKLGDPTARLQGRLTLNPLVHLEWFGSFILPLSFFLLGTPFIFGWAKPVPFNPYHLRNPKWGAALVAAMGPITNLLIASIAATFLYFLNLSPLWITTIHSVIAINVSLAVFNLLPFPPLDGHHILFALVPDSFSHLKEELRKYSWMIVILFLVFGASSLSPIIHSVYQLFIW